MRRLNVYSFTVHLKSHGVAGQHQGDTHFVISDNADHASEDLKAFIGDDLHMVHGPTTAIQGALFAEPEKTESEAAGDGDQPEEEEESGG